MFVFMMVLCGALVSAVAAYVIGYQWYSHTRERRPECKRLSTLPHTFPENGKKTPIKSA